MNTKKTDREESFEEWAEKNAPEPSAFSRDDVFLEAQEKRRGARKAWNHQAKKIEALKNKYSHARIPVQLSEEESVALLEHKIKEYKEKIEVLEIKVKKTSLLETRNKNLIAALKKAEGAMFGACDKSLTVPEDIKEYRDSPEYQAIKHLLKED